MQYLMLIYGEESCEPRPGTAEGDAHLSEYLGTPIHVAEVAGVRVVLPGDVIGERRGGNTG